MPILADERLMAAYTLTPIIYISNREPEKSSCFIIILELCILGNNMIISSNWQHNVMPGNLELSYYNLTEKVSRGSLCDIEHGLSDFCQSPLQNELKIEYSL